VPGLAGARPTVHAMRRPAGGGPTTAAAVPTTMHGPEGRGGDGGEHQRVLGHSLRDGLAARNTGADQLEHVAGVKPRTRRAFAGSAVAAPQMGDPQRLPAADVAGQDLAGATIDGLGVAVQPDRVRAVADPGQRLGPSIKAPRGEQFLDLLLDQRCKRRKVQRGVLGVAGESRLEQSGQGVCDRVPSRSAHRRSPPKGCATRLVVIPPRGTPGSGGPRSLAETESRRGDRYCAEPRQTKDLRGRCCSSLCVCSGAMCVRPLARVESRPPGEYPT